MSKRSRLAPGLFPFPFILLSLPGPVSRVGSRSSEFCDVILPEQPSERTYTSEIELCRYRSSGHPQLPNGPDWRCVDADRRIHQPATAITWLWARTGRCPNVAGNAQMPLVSPLWPPQKKCREIWMGPVVSSDGKGGSFSIHNDKDQPLEDTIDVLAECFLHWATLGH